MANKVLLKKSSVAAKVPLATDLDYGELALNYTDEKLYFKNASNVIKSISAVDTSSFATLTGTQTLTNKTISGASNTLSNIGNSSLTNSSVTIGSTAVSLGATATTLAGLTSVTSTTFVGALTGNASTATSATNATNATNASQVFVGLASANSAFKVPFADTTVNTAGNYTLLQDTESTFTYNPSTNTLTAGTFSGSGSGLTSIPAANLNGTVAIANGGTGQTSRQAAMDALAGAVTSGQYLRGNGTDVVMSAIQAADVPTLNQNTTGSAATLTTGRTIAITGDLTYTSGSFNGSANVTGTATLANSGVTAGTYTKVTVDAKGRVTTGASILAADVPTLNQNTTGSAATLTTARTINTVSFNGSANIVVEPYVENDDSTNATRYITFVDSSTAGHQRLNEDSNFTINPSTGTVTTNGAFASTFALNKNTIDVSYSIPSGYNAVAAGPVVINNGITVTIPTGSTWVIV
jgi:hypothetical protein